MDVPDHLHQHIGQLIGIETDAAYRRSLWAVILGLRPELDGDQWCVLWGPNIQEGIVAFGDSPSAALVAFDVAMNTSLRKALEE